METKKILFISYDGMTDPLGQSQVLPYLSNLTKFGYTFTILSCDKVDAYAANKEYVEKLIAPFPINWVSIPYHKNPVVFSAIYDYYALKKTAKKLQAIHQFDLVHARPGIPTLVALYLKKKMGIKFLDDIRGFWADERVDGGLWNLKKPFFKLIYNFFKRHEIECICKADYVVCLTHTAQKEIHSWKNIPNQPIPIEVIPCSADMNLFDENKIDQSLKEQFRIELNLQKDDIIFSYLGSIVGWYLLDEMIHFYKKVSDRIPNAKFLFISANGHEIITTTAHKYGLPAEKVMIKQGRRHEVPVLLSLCNYSLFFIKPCYSKMASSPTKHGEVMAMGIPVITNSGICDVSEIVTKYDAGYVINDFSDESFEVVIEKIIAGKSFNKSAIRKGAEDFYSLENAVCSYQKVYSKIFR
jgi:glycosyltransferase involved in cell wall biosynthesis